MPIVIELTNVSKIYGFGDATTVALDEVSLTVQKGEFVAIMGPSGSGKSTLLHLIGLLDRPTHGSYVLSNKEVARLRQRRLARTRRDHIGFIFQSFNLLPRLSALDNVALPLAYKGMPQTRRLKLASHALERVGLQDREYYLPKNLSGGQAQRVAIARALINNPSLIIADEPTGNLDSLSSKVVMEILAELHATGSTILMVTHNPELTRYANRILYMTDGSIMFDEQTRLGEVPIRARNGGNLEATSDEEETLAGISAFMNTIPEKAAPGRKSIRKKPQKPGKSVGRSHKTLHRTPKRAKSTTKSSTAKPRLRKKSSNTSNSPEINDIGDTKE